jgi:predicted molibdopterin-dependent oxidoreductase YjgC
LAESSHEINIVINGQPVKANSGQTVLEAAEAAGVYIPTLCHHPLLSPSGSCRLCVVEVKGIRGLPPACNLPAKEGMVISTETPRVQEFRKAILGNIIREHPRDCLTCAENLRCELQRVVSHVQPGEIPFTPGVPQLKEMGPFFIRDYNLCVMCGRCVRVCREIRGNRALCFLHDDHGLHVGTPLGAALADTDCESCGACVDVCPTGALRPKTQTGLAERIVKTICPYCGVGCQLNLEIKQGKILQSTPDRDGPANHGQSCVKGHFGIAGFVHSPERLISPLIRREGELKEASWNEALDLVATKLSGYKPGKVAVIASAKCTNEDNYVMQKLARAVLGTNNVDHCARL